MVYFGIGELRRDRLMIEEELGRTRRDLEARTRNGQFVSNLQSENAPNNPTDGPHFSTV
ncbi:hypothetical protein LINGRAHAP2_LOCUS24548 [Linum grandiflorum]